MDASEHSQKCVQKAKEILKGYPEAQIIVVYASSLPAVFVEPYSGFVPEEYYEGSREFEKKKVERIRHEVLENLFSDMAGRVAFETAEGHPVQVICDVAQRVDADLIVIGSKGAGAINRAFVGSVCNGVVHKSKVPVLVVK